MHNIAGQLYSQSGKVANDICVRLGIRVELTGGVYRSSSHDLIGHAVAKSLTSIYADTVIFGMTLGVSWSTASNGAILGLLIPIFGALIAVWLLRERLSTLRVGALLLGLAGVCLLSPLHSAVRSGTRTHEFAGNVLIATGCLGSAFYNVYSKRLLDYFSGIEILFFSYLSTTVFSLPVLFMFEPHCLSGLAQITLTQLAAFGYLAVFLYGVSMVLFLRALGTVDVVIASASLYLMPLFGVALAFSILGEHLGPRAILGSVIVLVATLILFRFDHAFRSGSPGLQRFL
jgi:drug/metabolite transporter (DMT)-like permease